MNVQKEKGEEMKQTEQKIESNIQNNNIQVTKEIKWTLPSSIK